MSATVFWADGHEFATLTNTFSVSGTPTDASAADCIITDPAGAQVTHTYNGAAPDDITRNGTGAYQLQVACTTAGTWTYLWEGTGTASDATAGTWTVTSPALNQRYCSAEELKSRLGITSTADDSEIQLAVESASRYVDEITGRYFWRGPDTRTYIPQSITRNVIDDLVSVTQLSVDRDGDGVFEEPWTLGTDYQLEVTPGEYNNTAKGETWPYTAAVVVTGGKLFPYTWMWSHLNRIQVSGVFGWPAVPAAVKQAALIIASDLFKLADAPLGVVGFGEFGAVKVTANPRVMQLLHRYITGQRVGV